MMYRHEWKTTHADALVRQRRRFLKSRKAVIKDDKPFTIHLTYDSDESVQPFTLGIDPGRTNISVFLLRLLNHSLRDTIIMKI